MSLLKITAEAENGREITLHTVYFRRSDVKSGKAKNYSIATDKTVLTRAWDALPGGSYTVKVEVTASNGEIFTPAVFTQTK